MKCLIIKSRAESEPDYVYTYALIDDYVHTIDDIDKLCYTSDEEEFDPSKVFQFYRGEHHILNFFDVDITKNNWKKNLKHHYPELII